MINGGKVMKINKQRAPCSKVSLNIKIIKERRMQLNAKKKETK